MTNMMNKPKGSPPVSRPQQQAGGAQSSGGRTVSRESIERRAYEIWERKGRPDGQCLQNWNEAEAELRR